MLFMCLWGSSPYPPPTLPIPDSCSLDWGIPIHTVDSIKQMRSFLRVKCWPATPPAYRSMHRFGPIAKTLSNRVCNWFCGQHTYTYTYTNAGRRLGKCSKIGPPFSRTFVMHMGVCLSTDVCVRTKTLESIYKAL